DHAAGEFGEALPVGAELELHRDAGDDAGAEIQSENADPEPRRRVLAAQAQEEDEQREPHRELRKQVVVGDGEAELEAMPEERIGHKSSFRSRSSASSVFFT